MCDTCALMSNVTHAHEAHAYDSLHYKCSLPKKIQINKKYENPNWAISDLNLYRKIPKNLHVCHTTR